MEDRSFTVSGEITISYEDVCEFYEFDPEDGPLFSKEEWLKAAFYFWELDRVTWVWSDLEETK